MVRDGLLAGGGVDGAQRPRDGADRLHGGADAQHLAAGHAALGTAEGALRARETAFALDDLVHHLAAAQARRQEAVAHLHALDGLDAHERGGQPAVQAPVPVGVAPQPRRKAVRQHLDDAAEGVALLLGRVHLGDQALAGSGVEDAHRALVHGLQVLRPRQRGGRVDRLTADAHDVAEHLHAVRLAQQRLGDRAERDAGGGLPGAGALEDGAGVVEAVLLHADEVGVAGPRPGQRGVAGQTRELVGVDRVGGHDDRPLGPLGVADADRDRTALRDAVPHPAEELDLVALEGHPRTAPVAEPAAGQLVRDVLRGQPDPGGDALDDAHQGRAVGLPCGQPAHHADSLPDMPGDAARRGPGVLAGTASQDCGRTSGRTPSRRA